MSTRLRGAVTLKRSFSRYLLADQLHPLPLPAATATALAQVRHWLHHLEGRGRTPPQSDVRMLRMAALIYYRRR